MSADQDVFEKLDALLRKHDPGALTSPNSLPPDKPVEPDNVIPLLTDIATPSIMVLSSQERSAIPVLTEVVQLTPPTIGIDLDQEFDRDLKSAVALAEENHPEEMLSAHDFLHDVDLGDDDLDFPHLATGPGIEVPPEFNDEDKPPLTDDPAKSEEIIEWPPLIDMPRFELITAEPEELSTSGPDASESLAAAPSEQPFDAPSEAEFESLEETEPARHFEQDVAATKDLAHDYSSLAAAPYSENQPPFVNAGDIEESGLIFDEMDNLPPEVTPPQPGFNFQHLDKHLQTLIEEKLGPQLTATMDRALADMLDQFSTHIEHLVRESVGLELQKQLEALRLTFAQQIDAQRQDLDRGIDKE